MTNNMVIIFYYFRYILYIKKREKNIEITIIVRLTMFYTGNSMALYYKLSTTLFPAQHTFYQYI